jgi:hypothetical protein
LPSLKLNNTALWDAGKRPSKAVIAMVIGVVL